MRFYHRVLLCGVTAGTMVGTADPTGATPYASNVAQNTLQVSFILNEPADSLKAIINGTQTITLDGTTKGNKTFNLNLATDTFSIVAEKNAATGYSIPTGGQIPADPGGLSIATNAGGLNQLSDDTNLFTRYNSPRGVGVSNNPNAANFGMVYIANSADAFTTDNARHLGNGMYAIHADQTDGLGYGDGAQNPPTQDTVPAFIASSSSPYRMAVAPNGEVWESDFADANSNVFVVKPDLTAARYIFDGFTGTSGAANPDGTSLAAGMNHGSTVAVYPVGSTDTNDLVVYTLDEDMTSAHATGNLADPTTDKYSLWKYTIGGTTTTVSAMPTKVADGLAAAPTFADFDRGADGKFYMSTLATAATTKLKVTDANGALLWDSLTASQALGSATDILTQLADIAVSPDQKYLAGLLNFSDVLVIPLQNGIPDLANRLVVDSGNVNSGRDIAFDAADNIHYVSSGQQLYRVLSPGGHTIATLAWNGSSYAFNLQTLAASLAGDFDHSGRVDAADYVAWRKGNSPNPNSIGDYNIWRANFGASAGSGSLADGTAVPEPVSAMLGFTAGLFAMCVRRRDEMA